MAGTQQTLSRRYLPQSECQRCMPPSEFPKRRTAFSYYMIWSKPGYGVNLLSINRLHGNLLGGQVTCRFTLGFPGGNKLGKPL